MFFSTYYVVMSPNLNINMISSYKNIRNKFILSYIEKHSLSHVNDKIELYSDALIYSKYYLYWKIYGCEYSNKVMDILYDVEFVV